MSASIQRTALPATARVAGCNIAGMGCGCGGPRSRHVMDQHTLPHDATQLTLLPRLTTDRKTIYHGHSSISAPTGQLHSIDFSVSCQALQLCHAHHLRPLYHNWQRFSGGPSLVYSRSMPMPTLTAKFGLAFNSLDLPSGRIQCLLCSITILACRATLFLISILPRGSPSEPRP